MVDRTHPACAHLSGVGPVCCLCTGLPCTRVAGTARADWHVEWEAVVEAARVVQAWAERVGLATA